MSDDAKTIFRSKHRRNYTTFANDLLYNPTLSGKAKWVLMYLLSKPEDWVTRVSDIVNHGTDGRSAILSAIKELKQAGYLRKVRVTCPDTGRVLRWETQVFDEPQPGNQESEVHNAENPDSGNPHSGKSNTTKYGSNQKTEQSNHSLTTTKENGSSERVSDASLLGGEALDREVGLVKWLLTTVPVLEQQYAIDLSTRLAKVCVGRSELDLLAAFLAMLQCEDSGKLRNPQRYLEDAIAGNWLPSKYWLENGESAAMWTIPQSLVDYIESKRPVEDLAELGVAV